MNALRTPAMHLFAAGAVCLAIGAWCDAAASAPSASEKAGAEILFQEAKALMKKGAYERACPKLEESQRVDPQAGTLLSLALCHESSGRVASAWIEYQEALALAKRSQRQERIQLAAGRLSALEKVVPRLTVEVDTAKAPKGLVVTRDGVEVSDAAWGVAVPVDPGEYELAASAPGHDSWKTRVRLEIGDAKQITIPVLSRTARQASAGPEPAPAERQSSSRRTWGWVVGGVGVASLAAGGYFGLRARSKESASAEKCSGLECSPEGLDLNRQAIRSANAANVLVPLGLIGAGIGTWLILGAPAGPSPSRTSIRSNIQVAASCLPGQASVVVDGSW